jgi:hypothetical protein
MVFNLRTGIYKLELAVWKVPPRITISLDLFRRGGIVRAWPEETVAKEHGGGTPLGGGARIRKNFNLYPVQYSKKHGEREHGVTRVLYPGNGVRCCRVSSKQTNKGPSRLYPGKYIRVRNHYPYHCTVQYCTRVQQSQRRLVELI